MYIYHILKIAFTKNMQSWDVLGAIDFTSIFCDWAGSCDGEALSCQHTLLAPLHPTCQCLVRFPCPRQFHAFQILSNAFQCCRQQPQWYLCLPLYDSMTNFCYYCVTSKPLGFFTEWSSNQWVVLAKIATNHQGKGPAYRRDASFLQQSWRFRPP